MIAEGVENVNRCAVMGRYEKKGAEENDSIAELLYMTCKKNK